MAFLRRVTATGCAAVLSLALTACSGDDPPSAADPATSATPTATDTATPPAPTPSGSPARAGKEVAAFLTRMRHGLGDEGSAHVRLTMSGPVQTTAEGDSAYGPDGNQLRLRMRLPELGGARLEMLVVDGTGYLAMPGVTPEGKYFELPAQGSPLSDAASGLSPADSFAAIEAGLRHVEELGSARIGGRSFDHYRLRVDSAAAMAALGAAEAPEMPKTVTYEVWLDARDRIRRVRSGVSGTRLTMDMTDWGKPVTITPPRADQLVDPPSGL